MSLHRAVLALIVATHRHSLTVTRRRAGGRTFDDADTALDDRSRGDLLGGAVLEVQA